MDIQFVGRISERLYSVFFMLFKSDISRLGRVSDVDGGIGVRHVAKYDTYRLLQKACRLPTDFASGSPKSEESGALYRCAPIV